MFTSIKNDDGSRNSFRQYVDLLCELHKLTVACRSDTPDADAIRDQMDEPWNHLDERETERVRGLSADLYSLEKHADLPDPLPHGLNAEEAVLRVRSERNAGSPDGVLVALRDAAPFLAPEQLAYLRGQVWLEIGVTLHPFAMFPAGSGGSFPDCT